MKRWQSLLLGLIISALALYGALRGAQLNRVAEALRTAHYEYALATVIIIAATTYVRGARWSAVLRGRMSTTRGFWLFNTGFLFNNVLPLRLGEIVRAYLAARRPPVRFAEALSSIVVERLLDMFSVVAILAVLLRIPELAVPKWASDAGLLMLAGAVVGIVSLFLAARYPDWVTRMVESLLARIPLPKRFAPEDALDQLGSFLEGLGSLREPRAFLLAVLISALAWVGSGLAGWVMLLAFDPFQGATLQIGFLAIAAAGLGIAVPSLPGAIGPFEAAVTLALVAAGYRQEAAVSYALVLHAVNYLTTSALGVWGLAREGMSFGQVASAARQMGKKSSEDSAEKVPVETT